MLRKLQFLPGIVQSNSEYAAPGRYTDAQWVRFVAGFAQKMGGWAAANADGALAGVCRNMLAWRDNSERACVAFGTHSKLFKLCYGTLSDITPLRGRNTGTLSGALATTNTSAVVTVNHTAHKQKVGDWVTLTASVAVGGLTIRGNYLVGTVPGADSYTITASSPATSTASGGGTLSYVYYRLLLGADPISTTRGSTLVDIADANSGCIEGDTVIFDGATAVGGIILSGPYVIVSAGAAGYSVNAAAVATETVGGVLNKTLGAAILAAAGTNGLSGLLAQTLDAATSTAAGTVAVSGILDKILGAATLSAAGTVGSGDIHAALFQTLGAATLSATGTLVVSAALAQTLGAALAAATATAATATATGGGTAVTVQNEISIGLIDAAAAHGYGVGAYGAGTYGTPRSTSLTLALRTWTLGAYGEWLLASPRGGALYVWDPAVGGRAIGLYGAPATMLSFFVTAERYIVALGTNGDSLRIAWADQLDPTAWTATTTNTANESRRISGGNFIVSGSPVRNQTSLVWTDTAAFLHQWRPDDFVFTTALMADKCGLIGPNAYAASGEAVYWVGDGHFWKWDGALSEVPSDDIAEWFFSRLDRQQTGKIVMGTLAAFDELIVLYQEAGETEIGHYLLYNITDRIWSTGTLQRTAYIDKGLLANPMATDVSGAIFDHEKGFDGAGALIQAWITAAPMDIDAGEKNLDIMGFLPDVARQAGALSLYVLTRQRAVDVPSSAGPFSVDTAGNAIDLRVDGKMAGYKLESNEIGGDFRIGVCRVEVQTGGARR